MSAIFRPGDLLKKPRMNVVFTYMGVADTHDDFSADRYFIICWMLPDNRVQFARQSRKDMAYATNLGKTSVSRYLRYLHTPVRSDILEIHRVPCTW